MSSEQINGFHPPHRSNGSASSRVKGTTDSTDCRTTTSCFQNTAETQSERQAYPMVSVKWKDAESQGGPTWEDAEEMLEFAKEPLVVVHTVGLLIHSDDEKVAITDTVSDEQMGGVTKIPRTWIIEMAVLTPAETFDDKRQSGSGPDAHPKRSVG